MAIETAEVNVRLYVLEEKEQAALSSLQSAPGESVTEALQSNPEFSGRSKQTEVVRNSNDMTPIQPKRQKFVHSGANSGDGVEDTEQPMPIRTIGAYEVLAEIGSGGMGVVYRARHCGSGKILAMKVLRGELCADPINVKRFQQEVKTTSSLTHPNIIPIYDSGTTDDGSPYFVMEYLDGRNLDEILAEEGYLDFDRFNQLFEEVCDALIHAHEKRIIHRDLKPSNIAICASENSYESVKILDFGIARVFQKASKEATRLTQLGEIVGSPTYMSPEQCLNQKLDERSDIYSLGVLMYECLSGVTPFCGASAVEVIMGHLQGRPKSIRQIRPDFDISPDLEALILTCLEKDPQARFQSVQELSVELYRISMSMRSSALSGRLVRWSRRMKSLLTQRLKSFFKSNKTWMVPACTIGAVGLMPFYAHSLSSPQLSMNDYIDQAQLALIHNNYEKISEEWNKAIAVAKRSQVADQDMAVLFERAGDDMVSDPVKQIRNNVEYSGYCDPQSPWPVLTSESTRSKNTKLAEEFYQKALALSTSKSSDDKIRVLDKLVGVTHSLHDDEAEEQYLQDRIGGCGAVVTVQNRGAYQELAGVLERLGRIDEAEAMWQNQIKVDEISNDGSSYPQSLSLMADFYQRVNYYDWEESLRRDLIARLRILSREEGADYSNAINQQLHKLSDCLRNEGKIAEANHTLRSIPKPKPVVNG